jgi:hypothetical protein
MRIGVRLGYSDVSAKFSQEEEIGNYETISGDGTVIVYSDHILEAKLSQIVFVPYFAYSFTENLIGNIGLNFGYTMVSTFNQREELLRPD